MIKKALLCALVLLVLGGYTGTAHAADKTAAAPSQTAPDNTGRNVRDRGGDTVTPGDQSNNSDPGILHTALLCFWALVGFQGRGFADGVQPDFCHSLLLEALIFQ